MPVGASPPGPISPDRPGVVNPPTVVGVGFLQIEAGVTHQGQGGVDLGSNETGAPGERGLAAPALEVRLGVHPRVQVALGFSGWSGTDFRGGSEVRGFSDLGVDLRAVICEQFGALPQTAIELDLSFPVGSKEITSGGVDPTLVLLGQWTIARRLTLGWNFEAAALSRGEGTSGRFFEFSPSVAIGTGIGRGWGVFFEYFASLRSRGTPDINGVDGGFTYLATPNLQFDVSAGTGFDAPATGYFVAAGVAWRLPRLWSPATSRQGIR
jgi:hypothetical protein